MIEHSHISEEAVQAVYEVLQTGVFATPQTILAAALPHIEPAIRADERAKTIAWAVGCIEYDQAADNGRSVMTDTANTKDQP
jgi:hypothetical protein